MSAKIVVGKREYFKGIARISYEGPTSTNPLAYKYYDEDRKVDGKTLRDHLRFAVCYWHTFCGGGGDPFGPGTRHYAWNESSDPLQQARDKLDAAFEFFSKLNAPFYCFHDRDIAPEGRNPEESERMLKEIVKLAKEKQEASGVRLLWGTANLFSHPRYMNGAATNPDFAVVAHAAAQVKVALEATVELGGANYVFWGGREGYSYLFNTDMKREREHMAMFLRKSAEYGRGIGFKGPYLIEPKPMEPSKHQYDFDSATVIGFLREFGLEKDFKLNVENNHATLAHHSFAHDLQVAADAGMLGSIDANRGDPQNGWDTDQFPILLYDCVEAMLVVLGMGGFTTGGFNFDAKIRRNSTDLEDIFLGHIGGMDAFARALLIASELRKDAVFGRVRRERYASFDKGEGARFERGELGLKELRDIAAKAGEPRLSSGKQELLENIVNQYLR